ncbi:ORF6N domain-containing protein [bacterium]|nr:ORF6N domain-containing protein [bacterium]
MTNEITNITLIEDRIFTIRGQKVMIDRDLAELYGVETKRLNEAVKRNIKRFPEDFMFRLTDEEQNELVAKCDHLKKLKYSYQNAYAFTEHGVTMLSSVLNSEKAIEINVQVVRAFMQLRKYALAQIDTNKELECLRTMLMLHIEKCDNKFAEHDKKISQIITVLNNLIEKPRETKHIGFETGN